MTDDLYRELAALTRRKELWQENISYVGSLLDDQPPKIIAKALWLLGEMGLQYPEEIVPYAGRIALFLSHSEDLFRERALNALGRIGRARFETVRPRMDQMLAAAKDSNPRVRLAFIWASENIATNTPEAYMNHMPLFAELLHDSDDRVRMEAPEMFRVMGRRLPKSVQPYLRMLQQLSENDPNPVVRIHSAGAIRITGNAL